MNNKPYIELIRTDTGYEIFINENNQKKKLTVKDKMIMKKILSLRPFTLTDNNTYKYEDFNFIMYHFRKNRASKKAPKVNRIKSKLIIGGIVAATVLSFLSINNKAEEYKNNNILVNNALSKAIIETESSDLTKFEQKYNTTENQDIIVTLINESTKEPHLTTYSYNNNEENIETETKYTYTEPRSEAPNEENYKELNIFNYYFDTPGDPDAYTNSTQYMDLFEKYERMYGVDARLLCAIGAQESSGIHHEYSLNGGYGTGLMGIEYIWDQGNIYVFNFETNEYEVITVDYSRIGELEYNIKVGAAIFQSYFYDTLKNNNDIDKNEQLAFSIQKYNMGPGNMANLLSMGYNWQDNRDMINAGDSLYFEHVLSRLDNDTTLNIRLTDGSYFQTTINNNALNMGRVR